MTDQPEAELVAYLDGIALYHATHDLSGAKVDVVGMLAAARSSLDATLAERDWLRDKLARLNQLGAAGVSLDASPLDVATALRVVSNVLSGLASIDREALVWRTPGLAATVREGLAQAARGETVDRGDFTQHLSTDSAAPHEAAIEALPFGFPVDWTTGQWQVTYERTTKELDAAHLRQDSSGRIYRCVARRDPQAATITLEISRQCAPLGTWEILHNHTTKAPTAVTFLDVDGRHRISASQGGRVTRLLVEQEITDADADEESP